MAVTATQQREFIKVGIGLYGAALGSNYLNLFAQVSEAGFSIGQIYNALMADPFSQQANLYPLYLTNEQFAARLVSFATGGTLTGDAKSQAEALVLGKLNAAPAGQAITVTRGEAAMYFVNLLDAAEATDPVFGAAAKLFDNRVTVASYYSVDKGLSSSSLSTLQTVVSGVSSTTDVSTTAALDTVISNSGTVTGQTFTLTTGVDQGASFTGGAGPDIFNSIINNADATKNTINAGDSLTGGDGVDQLSIVASGTGNTTLSGFYLSGIETLQVQNADATATNAITISLAGSSSLTTVKNQASTAGLTLTDASKIVALELNSAQDDTSITYAAAAVVGTADVQNVTLNGANTAASGTLAFNGIETLAITAAGANSGSSSKNLAVTGDASLKTVTIAGDKSVSLNLNLDAYASGTQTATVDASKATGAVTATVTVTGGDKVAVTGGTGNDSFTLTNITGNGVAAVDGGTGTDTLAFTGNATQTDLLNVKGIENFSLSAGSSVDLTKQAAEVATVTYASGTGAATLTGVNSGVSIVAQDAGTSLGVTVTNASTGTADVVSLTIGKTGATGTTGLAAGTLTATNVETIAVTSNGLDGNTSNTNTLTVAGTSAKTVTVAGATNFTLTQSGSSVSSYDATAATGKQNTAGITFAAAGATVVGGSAADTLTTGVEVNSITGGAGADTISAGGGNDTVDGGAGNDNITGGAGADVLTGGADADTFSYAAATESSVTAMDTIKDFVSGTDKISGTGALKFKGNFGDIVTGLASVSAVGDAFLVTSTNTLYVSGDGNGSLNDGTDYVIKLEGVTSLAAADLALGTQGTGSAITITATNANVTNSLSTNATAKTTALDDTISSQAQYVNTGTPTIDGGVGADKLVITDGGGTLVLASVTGVETLDLTGASAATNTGTLSTGFTTVLLSGKGDTVVTSATATSVTGGAGADNITGGAAADTITGAAGNDTLSGAAGADSVSGGDGDDGITIADAADSVDGGAGNDTVTVGTAQTFTGTLAGGDGSADKLALITASNIAGATVSGFEVLDLAAGNTATTMTLAQLNAFTSITTATGTDAITLTGAGGSYTALNALVEQYDGNGLTSGLTFTSSQDVTGLKVTGASAFANTVTLSSTTDRAISVVGGSGNDSLTLASGTFDTGLTDTLTGGTGTDSLTLTGNVAVNTGNLTANFSGFESITVANTTTNVTIVFNNDANVTDAAGMTVNAGSLTTGKLSFTALTAEAGGHTVTGGGSDDTMTGGSGADSLVGGAGGDSLTGGAGNDTLVSGSGNNVLDGGVGNDTINLTDGGSDVIKLSNGTLFGATGTSLPTTVYLDTVTGFAQGADAIQLGAGNLATTATAAITFSNGNGGDVAATALGAGVVTTAAANATVDAAGAASTIVKFTSTTATSFASAIGTGSITIANFANNLNLGGDAGSAEALAITWYDSTNARMVISAFVAANADTALTAADAANVVDIAVVGMSAADYTALVTGNFSFA